MVDTLQEEKRQLTISPTAKAKVLAFLRQRSIQGKCQIPVSDIAKELDYSNTTAYRAIKRLEADGVIRIQIPKNPTIAATIYLLEETSIQDTIVSTKDALATLKDIIEAAKNIEPLVVALSSQSERSERDAKRHDDFVRNVMAVIELPESGMLNIMVRVTDETAWLKELVPSLR